MNETINTNQQIKNGQIDNNESDEVDFTLILKRIWQKRRFIIWVTLAFIIIGLMVALFTPKQYTAKCVLVPQTNDNKGNSSTMSSLASLAGITLNGNLMSGSTLSPLVFPQILSNIDYQKELMNTPLKFEDYDKPISLLDYYTNQQYAKTSFFGTIKKYTIGLPSLILSSLKKGNDTLNKSATNLNYLTKDEQNCKKILDKKISLLLDDKKGYLTLTVNMNEPLATAQLADAAFQLLQKYITNFKIQKATNQQQYIKSRYDEAKAEYERCQYAYAHFQDANRLLSTATSQIEAQRLKANFDLSYSIYSQLSNQLIQADLQVKEDTPILTAVDPIVIPYEKSKPKRAQIMVIWTFLGLIFGTLAVFGFDQLHKSFNWSPSWWDVENIPAKENEAKSPKED